MDRIETTSVAALLAALTSCFPHRETFYRPDAPTGRIADATCLPQPTFLLLDRDGVVIGTRASDRRDGLTLDLTFAIPARRTVRLLGDAVHVVAAGGATSTGHLSGSVLTPAGARRLRPLELLRGADVPVLGLGQSLSYWSSPTRPDRNFRPYQLRGRPSHRPRVYWYTVDVTAPRRGRLLVRFPPFLLDGTPHRLPDVTFTPVSVTRWRVATNC